MSESAAKPAASSWHFDAAVAAWLVPGLGHYLLGERQRGGILAITIGVLWLGGLLMGGVSVFNRQEHPAWFLGQALIAPSFAVDYYQGRLRAKADYRIVPDAENPPPFEPAFGRVQEQGVLYTALAGLLNLLAIIDVLHRDPRRQALRDAPPKGGEAPEGQGA